MGVLRGLETVPMYISDALSCRWALADSVCLARLELTNELEPLRYPQ